MFSHWPIKLKMLFATVFNACFPLGFSQLGFQNTVTNLGWPSTGWVYTEIIIYLSVVELWGGHGAVNAH